VTNIGGLVGDGFSNKDNAALPSPAEVKACLERILAVDPFRESPQLSAFLKYVVGETLAGKGSDLKGYSIATLALGRNVDFDPQSDPIVRVQAGRVRQALAEYYASSPREKILISLQKGTYEPKLVYNEVSEVVSETIKNAQDASASFPAISATPQATPTVAPELVVSASNRVRKKAWMLGAALVIVGMIVGVSLVSWWMRSTTGSSAGIYENFAPSLVVEGGSSATDHPDLVAIVQRTRDAVSRFDDIIIVHDGVQSLPGTLTPIVPKIGQQFALRMSGSEAGTGKIRIAARLVDVSAQAVVWSREFDPILIGPSDDIARTRIVQSVATTIAQPYGVIHAYVRTKTLKNQNRDDPYGCLIAGFDYWLANDSKTHAAARKCLLDRIARFPSAGAFHAQLTYLYLEEFRVGYNPLPGDPLERALASASRSVSLSPTSARSYQALMAAHFSRREMDSAWRAGGEAMALNPYDTEIVADMGARHVQSGNFEKGLTMLQQALELNTAPPTWAVTFRAMALYMLGRADESTPLIRSLQGSEYPPAMMALVVVAFNSANVPVGKRVLAEIKRLHPEILANPLAFLQRLNFEEKIATRMIEEFTRAQAWLESR
jgi:tetratricopeptide (TPR) repeat protein